MWCMVSRRWFATVLPLTFLALPLAGYRAWLGGVVWWTVAGLWVVGQSVAGVRTAQHVASWPLDGLPARRSAGRYS